MTLLSYTETRHRNRDKTLSVLRFLRTSIYSTAQLLGELTGIKSRQAIHKTLAAMEKKGLLRHQTFHEFTGDLTLWGITPAGQEACLQDGEEPVNVFFNTAKVSSSQLQHYLSIQHIRIRAEVAGWRDFIYCDRRKVFTGETAHTTDIINEKIRPDLLAVTPQNRKVAIECERLMKWTPRYRERVIPGHIRRLNAAEYDQVIWVCLTPDKEEKLKAILAAALRELKDDRQLNLERTSKEFKTFAVTNMTIWPNL